MSVLSNLLLQFVFPVIDSDGVIMSVKSMNQRLKHKSKIMCISPHIISLLNRKNLNNLKLIKTLLHFTGTCALCHFISQKPIVPELKACSDVPGWMWFV